MYFSIFLSINLCMCQFIYIFIYLSVYLSICLYVNLPIYILTYSSGYVYLHNGTVECYNYDSFEMLFDNDWSKILLQKTPLNQRERTCCLNLNWWNNLNLIVMLSNSWDALPSLVNTDMFIISDGYRQTKLGFEVEISFVFLGMLVFSLRLLSS